jgi:hypothetical protein
MHGYAPARKSPTELFSFTKAVVFYGPYADMEKSPESIVREL